MKTYQFPNKEQWNKILKRPVTPLLDLEKTVTEIFQDIKQNGDSAVKKYTKKFDDSALEISKVSDQELSDAQQKIDPELQKAIELAKRNIELFHSSQKEETKIIETLHGVHCWRKNTPIEKVGLYVPGGTAPLFSTVLMLGIPAKIAGCKEIVVCTPPNSYGKINPIILYTSQLIGINNIYKIGGIQAIAAMTYGTETVPKVYKIFGPGNQYVTAAKQIATRMGIAIDMPAGPSEVLVYADSSADPDFVAADLLSQAEHSTDSQVILITPQQEIIEDTQKAIQIQLQHLPRKTLIQQTLKNSIIIQVKNKEDALELINHYAPEHLIICSKDEDYFIHNVVNAGSVFIGNYTPESAGDYASGTNHTLPTNGYAKTYSGLSLDTFLKKITFQKISPTGLKNIGKAVEKMAEAEQLDAHKNSVTVRLKKLS